MYPTLVIILVAYAKRSALPKSSSDIDLERIAPTPPRDVPNTRRDALSDCELDSTISLYMTDHPRDNGVEYYASAKPVALEQS